MVHSFMNEPALLQKRVFVSGEIYLNMWIWIGVGIEV